MTPTEVEITTITCRTRTATRLLENTIKLCHLLRHPYRNSSKRKKGYRWRFPMRMPHFMIGLIVYQIASALRPIKSLKIHNEVGSGVTSPKVRTSMTVRKLLSMTSKKWIWQLTETTSLQASKRRKITDKTGVHYRSSRSAVMPSYNKQQTIRRSFSRGLYLASPLMATKRQMASKMESSSWMPRRSNSWCWWPRIWRLRTVILS